MNAAALLQQPFFQVTLPIIIAFVTTIWVTSWSQNKRLDEMSRRFDDRIDALSRRFDDRIDALSKRIDDRLDALSKRIDDRLNEIVKRLDRIEVKLDNHAERIAKLEEHTSPITRQTR